MNYFTALLAGVCALLLALGFGMYQPGRLGKSQILACQAEEQYYQFHYSSQGWVDTSLLPLGGGQRQDLQVNVTAQVAERCAIQSDGQFLRTFAFDFEHMDVFGVESSQIEPDTAQVYLRYQPGKGEGELRFSTGLGTVYQNALRDFFARSRITWGEGNQWQAQERDSEGVLQVAYQLTRLGIKGWQLRKFDWQYQADQDDVQLPVVHTNSYVKIQGQGQVLSSIEIRWQTETPHAGRPFSGVLSKMSYTKATRPTFKRRLTQVLSDWRRVQELPGDDFAATKARTRTREQMDRQAVGQQSWDDLIELARRADTDDATTQTFVAMRSYFNLHPQEAVKAQRVLRDGSVEDQEVRIVALALARSHSTQAKEVLWDVMRAGRSGSKEQLYLLGLIGVSTKPTPGHLVEMVRFADQEDHPDARQTAELAVGNLARAVKQLDPVVYQSAWERAKQRFYGASSSQERMDVLHCLGNFGEDAALSLAVEALQDKDPQVRAVALGVLRFLNRDQSERVILDALSRDSAQEVRDAAAYELTFRQMTAPGLELIRKIIRQTRNETGRALLLQVMANHAVHDPDVKEDIAFIQRNDPSKSIRHQAASILARI